MALQEVFTDKVKTMQPYHVVSSSGLIKLNDMESPYKLPEEMRKALGTVLSMTHINRYPNSHSTALASGIKTTFQLPDTLELMMGNGSDELIQIILMAVAKPNAVVLSPVPSFVMYSQTAEILGMRFVGIDLNADFSMDEAAFLAAIEQHQPAVVFLAYPNNPTGNLWDKAFIREVMQRAPGLVVIDEAYTAYAPQSAADIVAEYDNAVLIRTLSKIGFAGIRLGYLAARPDLLSQLEKVRMPYNINVLTQTTARFMLEQTSYINQCVKKLLAEKQVQYDWLVARDDVKVTPTAANFLLLRVADADTVFARLRDEYRILVKNLHGVHPLLDNTLRISIGRKKENAKLREALTAIL